MIGPRNAPALLNGAGAKLKGLQNADLSHILFRARWVLERGVCK